ncbi:MAG: prepilin-type N-terminal cleavage/methylation domain-containing protein [Gemmatimonadaceae bacterium]
MMQTKPNSQWKRRTRRQVMRRGFTLIEVLIAITILAGVVLTMAMNTTNSSRNVATSGTRSRAQALLDQQISRARIWPTYSTLGQLTNAKYNGASNGLTPTTVITVDTTSGKNLTTVTVTVTGPASVLPTAMIRSISIAAP